MNKPSEWKYEIFASTKCTWIYHLQHGIHLEQLPWVNSSPPVQNGRHFADDIFICISVKEKYCVLIKISLQFVPKGPIDNKPALV